MTLSVEADASKSVELRTKNYYKIEYSALNFRPASELKPCTDLEGMKAKIEYFEGLKDPAEAQIVSIELSK